MSFIELMESLVIYVLGQTRKAPKNRRTEPPPGFLVGSSRSQTDAVAITISDDERRRHIYIIGATGSGKSNLIARLLQDEVGRWP